MATNIPTETRQYYLPKSGSFDNLALRTKKIEQPKPTQVLVRVHAVSLQHRDLDVAMGTYHLGTIADVIPCSDMAGQVVAVGQDIKNFKPGDRVCANCMLDYIAGDITPEVQQTSLGVRIHGVLTEYRKFPAHGLVKFPEHLSYEEASTLPCAALTAYNALMGPKPLKAGDSVLVLGTGGVATFGLQLAAASGAVVIATSSSDEKLNHHSKLGATHIINYKKTPEWEKEVMRLTEGQGVDHVLEVGGAATMPKSIQATRMGGSLHLVGSVAKDEIDPAAVLPSVLTPTIFKSTTLRGVYVGSVKSFVDMNRLISANPEETRPVIDKVFTFEQVKDAYKHLDSQAHIGKVVIRVAND